MNNGWIKLHRKLLDNPLAKKPAWFSLWVTLLLLANHDNRNKFIWQGKEMEQKAGEFITGRKALSDQTGIPESTVEDILKFLENSCQIRQQKTTKHRLITIINWNLYQDSDNKATTKQQQTDTIKKLRSKEEDKDMPPGGDIETLIKEKKGIQHDFQFVGLEIFEKTGAPPDKKGECIRLAKKYPSFVDSALSFSIDYPNQALRWKMFLWKLHDLIKKNEVSKGNTTAA